MLRFQVASRRLFKVFKKLLVVERVLLLKTSSHPKVVLVMNALFFIVDAHYLSHTI